MKKSVKLLELLKLTNLKQPITTNCGSYDGHCIWLLVEKCSSILPGKQSLRIRVAADIRNIKRKMSNGFLTKSILLRHILHLITV